MDYSSYVTALSTLTAISPTDTNFLAILPDTIAYGENRIYRDLDMLVEDVTDGSGALSANDRSFTLPTTLGKFQIVSDINIITPAGTAPEAGSRNPCTPVSRAVLDMTYGSVTAAGVPEMYAYVSQSTEAGQTNIIFGPWPDAAYRVEVVGKIIPAPLSSTNTTTFLSLYLPDLFLAASMVFFTGGYMKNFGSQGDSPKEAQSWESQYVLLRESAGTWEARKRFAGASWTSKQPEPTAVNQRG